MWIAVVVVSDRSTAPVKQLLKEQEEEPRKPVLPAGKARFESRDLSRAREVELLSKITRKEKIAQTPEEIRYKLQNGGSRYKGVSKFESREHRQSDDRHASGTKAEDIAQSLT